MEITLKVFGQAYNIIGIAYMLLSMFVVMFILIIFLIIKVYKLSKKYFCLEYEIGLPYIFRMKGSFKRDETIMLLTNEIETLKFQNTRIQNNTSLSSLLLFMIIMSFFTPRKRGPAGRMLLASKKEDNPLLYMLNFTDRTKLYSNK